jgi:hypothetical protein
MCRYIMGNLLTIYQKYWYFIKGYTCENVLNSLFFFLFKINDFPEKVSFYIMNSVSNFKSQWPEIRSNAVLFAGYLLGNLSKDKQSVLSKEHITNGINFSQFFFKLLIIMIFKLL